MVGGRGTAIFRQRRALRVEGYVVRRSRCRAGRACRGVGHAHAAVAGVGYGSRVGMRHACPGNVAHPPVTRDP